MAGDCIICRKSNKVGVMTNQMPREIKFCSKCGEYLIHPNTLKEECSNPGCPVRIYDGEDTPP